jgi:glycine cleavage system aminomethyltransferase T
MDKNRETPFLYQGPFSHVPCQIVTLSRDKEKSGVVLTCSRGYAKDMVDAILHAGEEFGLKPAGEKRVIDWISSL